MKLYVGRRKDEEENEKEGRNMRNKMQNIKVRRKHGRMNEMQTARVIGGGNNYRGNIKQDKATKEV
jgi:hypothetical protein